MLNTGFYFLINMSISGSFIIIILMLLRLIKRFPKRLVYSLWALVFARLIMPFAISGSASLYNYLGQFIKRLIPVGHLSDFNFTATNYLNLAIQYSPLEYRTQRLNQVFHVALLVWFWGTVMVLLLVVVQYRFICDQYSDSVLLKGNIYRNDKAISPFLLGIVQPKVILNPKIDIDSVAADYIIAHENIHIKRHDNLWRLLGLVIACIHWFNPLVWLAFFYFLKDMELSCDEAVIKNYSPDERKEYANTLLSTVQVASAQTSMFAGFGKADTKTRILRVLSYQRISLFGILLSIIFFLVMAAILLTNPI